MELLRDVRLSLASEVEERTRAGRAPHRCVVCDRRLPHGVERAHCLEHSTYAQSVIARERRRTRRAALRRVA